MTRPIDTYDREDTLDNGVGEDNLPPRPIDPLTLAPRPYLSKTDAETAYFGPHGQWDRMDPRVQRSFAGIIARHVAEAASGGEPLDAWWSSWAFRDAGPTGIVAPVPIEGLDRAVPPPLLLGRLDPIETTMLYGRGGSGKGALAAYWVTELVKLGIRVLVLDYEGHPDEWARRLYGLAGDAVEGMVAYLAPNRVPALGPIWDHADRLAAWCAASDIGYVVIDSVTYACLGGDVIESTTATRYTAALQTLGVPSLSIAHVNRAGDESQSFGSAFWHNGMRVTWNLAEKGEDLLLTCHKANSYAKPGASAVTLTFYEDVLREVSEVPAGRVLLDRIVEVLTDKPLTVAAIMAALNDGVPEGERIARSSVTTALARSLKRPGGGPLTVTEGLWSWRASPS